MKNLLLGILAKAGSAIMKIIKDPIGFLGNLVSAVGAGLNLFVTNIADHLKTGVVSWLLGTAVKAGLELPEVRHEGHHPAHRLPTGPDLGQHQSPRHPQGRPRRGDGRSRNQRPRRQKHRQRGPAGAVKEIQAEVGDLKATILGKLTSYLIPTVITAGITWILSS
ncbi:hypothetical protein NKH18_26985 [Streptomyces sp. M10(2022)]